jgi:3-oxoacyl-[acyl-carrier-protein] synthase II
MKLKRVVITGLGALTPLGNTVSEFWDGLARGVSGAGFITHFDTTNFKTKFACEVKNFDPLDYLDRKEMRKMDRYVHYGLAAVDEMMKDSGLNLSKIDLDRAGVIWASGIGGLDTFEKEAVGFEKSKGVPRFNPFFIPKMIPDIAAGHISIKYGFRGPNFATVSACASSANAIADSFNYIRLGKAKLMITGGSEAAVTHLGIGGFNAMHAISTRNDSPETASRPFDLDRDGFVLAEGGAALLLEEYEHAVARGAKIYAEIVGSGLTGDAYHMTAPHPEGYGAMKAMEFAIEDAGIKKEEVDHINTHGTSTPVGDIAEPMAIHTLFGEHASKLAVNSTKSMTGHLLGAAGAIEAIACTLSIRNNFVPPTINHFTDDPKIVNSVNFIFNKGIEKELNYALSNTFGFGGHNASILIKKYKGE